MKDIVKFIKESVSVYRLNKVVAKYLVQPSELIFQAPENAFLSKELVFL